MKKFLEDFYNNNKPDFEITAVVFVITTLSFSIPSANGLLLSKSIEQIKFFLLLTSCILIIRLVFKAMEIVSTSVLQKNQDPNESSILFLILSSIIAFLFTVNLIIYLLFSFPKESYFLAISSISYLLLCVNPLKRLTKDIKYQYVSGPIFSIFLLNIPVTSYIFFYFDIELNKSTLIIATEINLIMCIILGLIILYRQKFRKRPPYLKS